MGETIIIALIGGGAGIISAIATVGFKIHEIMQARKGRTLEARMAPIIERGLKPTNDKIDALQLDVTRLRLLSLIRNEPKDAENILKIASLYFATLKGDSEASKQFTAWLRQEDIKCPEWFKAAEA